MGRIIGFAGAVFCLLVSSCDLPPGWGDEKGSLTIVLPGASLPGQRAVTGARAVRLPEELTNDMSYDIKLFSDDNDDSKLFAGIREKVITVDLRPGHWFIGVMASYGSTPAGISETETNIQPGRENFVSLTMAADDFITPSQDSWYDNNIYIGTVGTGNSVPDPFLIDISTSTEFTSFPGWIDSFSYKRYYQDADGNRTDIDTTFFSFPPNITSLPLSLPVYNTVVGTFSYYVEVMNEYTYTSPVTGEITTGTGITNIHVGDVTVVPYKTWEIGDTGPGGGVVFYAGRGFTVNGKVYRYLEAGPSLGPCSWSSSLDIIGGTRAEIGTGWINTEIIINALKDKDPNSAAHIARGHNGGAKSDWFLPSQFELQELYKLDKSGPETYGWTSTESSNPTMACRIRKSDGNLGAITKNVSSTYNYVRPIRAFTDE
jgi:hypothetical protein